MTNGEELMNLEHLSPTTVFQKQTENDVPRASYNVHYNSYVTVLCIFQIVYYSQVSKSVWLFKLVTLTRNEWWLVFLSGSYSASWASLNKVLTKQRNKTWMTS
jgi:hypothetical protein